MPLKLYAAQQIWHSNQRFSTALYVQFIYRVTCSPRKSTAAFWQDHATSCTNNCKKFKPPWQRKDLTSHLFCTFHENLKACNNRTLTLKLVISVTGWFFLARILSLQLRLVYLPRGNTISKMLLQQLYPIVLQQLTTLYVLSLAVSAQINTSNPRNRRDLFCSC